MATEPHRVHLANSLGKPKCGVLNSAEVSHEQARVTCKRCIGWKWTDPVEPRRGKPDSYEKIRREFWFRLFRDNILRLPAARGVLLSGFLRKLDLDPSEMDRQTIVQVLQKALEPFPVEQRQQIIVTMQNWSIRPSGVLRSSHGCEAEDGPKGHAQDPSSQARASSASTAASKSRPL